MADKRGGSALTGITVALLVGMLTKRALSAVGVYGPPAIFGLMVLESMGAPLPSEIIQPFAGFMSASGRMGFLWAVAAGVAGNMVGAWASYYIGLKGGRELVLRYGRYVGIRKKDLGRAEGWFERKGAGTVFVCRMLPLVRGFVSYPAGASRMNLAKFSVYTFLGCVPWVAGLTYAGRLLGNHWREIGSYMHYLSYAVILCVVLAVVYLLAQWLVKRRS
jgi:membrane protein DedA with SNARE-associated domain